METLYCVAKDSDMEEIFMSALKYLFDSSRTANNISKNYFLNLIKEAKNVKASVEALRCYEKSVDKPLDLIKDFSFIFLKKMDEKIVKEAFLILIRNKLITEGNFADTSNIYLLFKIKK